jgi:predicted aspartyl protease
MKRCARLFLFLLLLVVTRMTAAQASTPVATDDALAEADTLYKSGQVNEAAIKFEALLAKDPQLVHARAALMRTRLWQQRTDDAYELGKAGMAIPGYTAELLAAMGDVEFRRGEMAEAEVQYQHAARVDATEARAYLGLARLYDAYSLHRKAYDRLKLAHDLAPKDPEVQRAWFRMLPRKQRLQSIEDYLSSPHPSTELETLRLMQYAEFLRATADKPVHPCKLVSKVEKTQTPLISLLRDSRTLRGFGLPVKLNDRQSRLLLDTGASGILVGRKAAERAGLERIANYSIGGIGDKGLQSAYTAVAKHIRIGELEFEDCVVSVSDRASVTDEDGLIGADVFSSYLIDIDGPGYMLRLSPLPKRPEEVTETTALKTDADDLDDDEAVDREAKKTADARLPKDRYVAPEMANWSRVFRFGHQLLIPTRVNDSAGMLFLIDTGATLNNLSTNAARKVTKVHKEERLTLKGLNGTVKNVYSADKAKLQFGHIAQQNEDIVTFDLSNISKHDGTEVSGLLGFAMLRLLELKIDYRDGLVDFSYDAKRVGMR